MDEPTWAETGDWCRLGYTRCDTLTSTLGSAVRWMDALSVIDRRWRWTRCEVRHATLDRGTARTNVFVRERGATARATSTSTDETGRSRTSTERGRLRETTLNGGITGTQSGEVVTGGTFRHLLTSTSHALRRAARSWRRIRQTATETVRAHVGDGVARWTRDTRRLARTVLLLGRARRRWQWRDGMWQTTSLTRVIADALDGVTGGATRRGGDLTDTSHALSDARLRGRRETADIFRRTAQTGLCSTGRA